MKHKKGDSIEFAVYGHKVVGDFTKVDGDSIVITVTEDSLPGTIGSEQSIHMGHEVEKS